MGLLPVRVEAQLGSPWFPVAPPHPVVWLQNLTGNPEHKETKRFKQQEKKRFLLDDLQD